MKICEVCGHEEENEIDDLIAMQTPIIHVCENCQRDRRHDLDL